VLALRHTSWSDSVPYNDIRYCHPVEAGWLDDAVFEVVMDVVEVTLVVRVASVVDVVEAVVKNVAVVDAVPGRH
jgi:hypothetical protein